ncbi:hypothetical protein KY363_00880 [Candidatus Woesearchaeota archaeon]|nr:hypothetical protein [Candidatus Woesearchaeota archaeon]
MGLAEKVGDYLLSMSGVKDARAAECIHSGRRQLHYNGSVYCLLSGSEKGAYCPLQRDKAAGSGCVLAECMSREYYKELDLRNKG